jgi:hypothetical protein
MSKIKVYRDEEAARAGYQKAIDGSRQLGLDDVADQIEADGFEAWLENTGRSIAAENPTQTKRRDRAMFFNNPSEDEEPEADEQTSEESESEEYSQEELEAMSKDDLMEAVLESQEKYGDLESAACASFDELYACDNSWKKEDLLNAIWAALDHLSDFDPEVFPEAEDEEDAAA